MAEGEEFQLAEAFHRVEISLEKETLSANEDFFAKTRAREHPHTG